MKYYTVRVKMLSLPELYIIQQPGTPATCRKAFYLYRSTLKDKHKREVLMAYPRLIQCAIKAHCENFVDIQREQPNPQTCYFYLEFIFASEEYVNVFKEKLEELHYSYILGNIDLDTW